MADNYTQMSSVLLLKNQEAADWLKAKLEFEPEDDPNWHGLGFEWAIENGPKGWKCWFHDNGETADIEKICEFVSAYLKEFDPKGSFVIEWASTCSKSRANEFGGGMLLVTAKKIHEAPGWVQALEKRHKLTRRNG